MASSYKIAQGHNVPLIDLAPFVLTPATIGLQHTRRSYAASGRVIDELGFVELEFSVLPEDDDDYRALLTQCGLLTATTALVTVQVQDENYNWVRRNGTIVRPLIGTDGQRADFWFKSFTFLVTKLRIPA